MRSLFIWLAGATLFFSSCQKEADAVAPTLFEKQIMGHTWLESTEEELPSTGIAVYRTQDFPFPAGRPRQGFRFEAEGVYTGRGPSAEDGLAIYPGRWIQESNDRLRIIPAGQPSGYGLQIIALHDGVLQVRRLP